VHRRLRPACEHRVGIATADQLGPFAHRRRAGRAGRHRRVVGTAVAEGDGDLAGGGVDEDARDEVRRHALPTAIAERLALLHDPDDAADRRAEEDAHAHRVVDAVESCVVDGLASGGERQEHVAVQATGLLRGRDGRRIEALHLSGDAHGEPGRVERADEVDAATAGHGRVPRLRSRVADGRDGAHTGDDDSSHRRSLEPCRAITFPSLRWKPSSSPRYRPATGSTSPSVTGLNTGEPRFPP